ncbi:uncharacterized protein BDZ99DRAFT_501914 [Mytilinidion resinicola]|uniref:BTB domain-containing protein n=1 Tax=Mytilinidion resinicola TaxID=574789 RepID=A0A6A6Y8S1_9PEZI|nr:uncharacterized protein BDZ99DRAFT_501914 [Mytilinidion resinicola]KAF2805019.1 hypothetical protein BDZ99DRAFT_501914 [Mytilinidion resinicola]
MTLVATTLRQVDGPSPVPVNKSARRKPKAKASSKNVASSTSAAPAPMGAPKAAESAPMLSQPAKATDFKADATKQADSPQQSKPSAHDEAVLSPLEFSKLKTGRKVSVVVGDPGNQYIAIEAAYVKVLSHYSHYLKQALASDHSSRLFIPCGDKNVLLFIYRWMLAGEQNSNAKNALKFEDLRLPDLITLYYHCVFLEYHSLREKTCARLEWKLKSVIPTIEQLSVILAYTPAVAESAVQAIARLFFRPVCYDFSAYLALASKDPEFGKALDVAIAQLKFSLVRQHNGRPQRRGRPNQVRIDVVSLKRQSGPQQNINIHKNDKTQQEPSDFVTGPAPKADAVVDATVSRRRRAKRTKPKAKGLAPAATQSQENAIATPQVALPKIGLSTPDPRKAPKNTDGEAGDAPDKGAALNKSTPNHFRRGRAPSSRAPLKPVGQIPANYNNPNIAVVEHRRPRRRAVEVYRNGEGITTSSREAKPGEMTRTGLVI